MIDSCSKLAHVGRAVHAKRSGKGVGAVTPWGVWGSVFGSRLFRWRDVWCLRWSERCVLFVLLWFVLVSSCVGALWSWRLVLVVMVLVAGWCARGARGRGGVAVRACAGR